MRIAFYKLCNFFVKNCGFLPKSKRKELKNYFNNKISSTKPVIKNKDDFIEYFLNNQLDKSHFVPLSKSHYKRHKNDPKLIAYYLPQFYEFKENNEWFGKGFTEWTNCTKAVPQFIGHHQPRIPIDVGFYNLDTTKIMHRQAELAKQYGIYGWCFYWYWFGGDRIMEKPVYNFLADKSVNMPFMLFWANEDWSRNWGESFRDTKKDVVFKAAVKPGDGAKFYADIKPFFDDARYIKIDGRPALIIYRTHDKNIGEFIKELENAALASGETKPYVIVIDSYKDDINPAKTNADAIAEFAMHSRAGMFKTPRKLDVAFFNKQSKISLRDMSKFTEHKYYLDSPDHTLFKGVTISFDNTSRKNYIGSDIMNISPQHYCQWTKDIIKWTRENRVPEQIIFVSAWNEWAEGMYLEPDTKFGYAYLQATKDAIEGLRDE